MSKELLIKYIELLLSHWKLMDDYVRVLGDISIYRIIDDAYDFIAELIGIDDEVKEFVMNFIDDYLEKGCCNFEHNGEEISLKTVEDCCDFILRWKKEF